MSIFAALLVAYSPSVVFQKLPIQSSGHGCRSRFVSTKKTAIADGRLLVAWMMVLDGYQQLIFNAVT